MKALLLGLLAAVTVAGCSGGTGAAKDAGETTTSAKTDEFRVALLTPGPVSDAGWSAIAYEGLKGVESETGAKIVNSEAAGTKIKDAMRTYAQDGYKLVIGHGFEYNEPAFELGEQFPDTVFLSSSGDKTSKNVGALRFYLEQGFYLAGIVAADLSKSGKLAMIGLNVPSINSTFKGFVAGAKSVRPDIDVKTIYINDDKDVPAATQATLQAIANGADLVLHQANAAAQGVFNACKQKGVYAFGANENQNDNESGVVLASATIVAKPAFVKVAQEVKAGKYVGGVTLIGMGDGGIDFIINPKLADKIPAATMAKVEEAKKKILSGELIVPKDDF